ncbi:tandem-95 repeat protein, partial [Flavihumibacter sp. R14]|nr:tandem-95 repeat protein [Flavihumibacter soli]
NDAPVALNDAYNTTEETPVSVPLPGVMTNDSDIDGDAITAIKVTDPANGTLVFNADGSFTYTPNANFNGTDSFTYKVNDGTLESNIATVIITVTIVNQSPIAADDHFELINTDLEGSISLNDYDPDGDSLVYSIITNPEHGEVRINPDGTFQYSPNPGFSGVDTLVYKVCDSAGLCAEAKVFLTSRPSAIVSLTPSYSKIAEGSKVTITAVLSQAFPEDVQVTLNYSGDAQNGKDYELFENFVTINIPAGQTIATEYFVLTALIDDLNEKEEQILISISDVNSDRVRIGSGAEVSILDLYPPSKEVSEETPNTDIKPDPLISPNGDGQGNERFLIDNIDLFPDNQVLIFNRWGNEVFRTNSYNNSENSFQGVANTGLLTNTNKDLPEGVYYYLIHTTDSDNKKRLNKGYLILKR